MFAEGGPTCHILHTFSLMNSAFPGSGVGPLWLCSGMEAVPGLAAVLAGARELATAFPHLSDEQLLTALGEIEELGRIDDALRIAAAAEVEQRSDLRLGEGRLAFRNGARDGVELVQQLARISHREAKRRIAIGAALAPDVSLAGELLPGRFPAVSMAVRDGRIGLESARIIVNAVKAIRARADEEQLSAMVTSLIDTATTADPETVEETAGWWALALDPDGDEPTDRTRRRKRALRLGKTLADGTTRATLILLPEHLAMLKELLQSRRRGVQLVRTEPGSDQDATTDGPEWREEHGPDGTDPRTRAEQDYDTVIDVLEAGAKAEAADTVKPVTHTTVVTITAAELEARKGRGWLPGTMTGLPVPTIEQRICTGETKLLVTGPNGEPLYLSRANRLFSPAQKLALTVAAGGRCQFPGCRTPAPYLEAHHVAWFCRDGGQTDIDNGIMLCSYHHHLVHAQHSPVEIRTHDGAPYIVPAGWYGPLRPEQRARTGPRHSPPDESPGAPPGT